MADISKITLPSGTTYNIKDATARNDISDLEQRITGGVHYIGVSTTAITDGGGEKPTIGGSQVTPVSGDLVIYGNKEFIFGGTYGSGGTWAEFGDMGSLKALAFKDTASGSYTPAGSVSTPTFTGNSLTSTGKFTPAGGVTISATDNTSGNYQPKGSVSTPTFTGNSLTSTGKFTPEGSVSSSFSGQAATITSKNASAISPTVTFTKNSSGSVQLTGSVSKPNIDVTPTTTTINSITSVGTLPSCTLPGYTVANETLTISSGSFSAGSLPSKGADTTVMTGVSAELAATPALTMDKYNVTSSIAANGITVSSSYTPTGSVSSTFTGTEGNVSVSGTPTGSVSQPTFTGTKAQISGSFTGTEGNVSVSGTPTGSVSQPTFTGTVSTITVS